MRIGFTGHQDIPDVACGYLAAELAKLFANRGAIVGVCCLAEGGDQLFAEAILENGSELEVVIPAQNYESTFSAAGLRRFLDLKSRASIVTVLDFGAPSEDAYMAAGIAVVDTSDLLVAAWDGDASRGLGGTADVVAYAQSKGKPVDVVWPAGVER